MSHNIRNYHRISQISYNVADYRSVRRQPIISQATHFDPSRPKARPHQRPSASWGLSDVTQTLRKRYENVTRIGGWPSQAQTGQWQPNFGAGPGPCSFAVQQYCCCGPCRSSSRSVPACVTPYVQNRSTHVHTYPHYMIYASIYLSIYIYKYGQIHLLSVTPRTPLLACRR